MTETNVFELTQPGTFSDPLTEVLRNGIAAHRELIHKIGVTDGKVEARIAHAATDATYLLADVEVIATYKLYNINRSVRVRSRVGFTLKNSAHPTRSP